MSESDVRDIVCIHDLGIHIMWHMPPVHKKRVPREYAEFENSCDFDIVLKGWHKMKISAESVFIVVALWHD